MTNLLVLLLFARVEPSGAMGRGHADPVLHRLTTDLVSRDKRSEHRDEKLALPYERKIVEFMSNEFHSYRSQINAGSSLCLLPIKPSARLAYDRVLCYLALAKAAEIRSDVKYFYLNLAYAKATYVGNKSIIDKRCRGDGIIASLMVTNMPSASVAKQWPSTRILVEPSWHHIKTENGKVAVNFGKKSAIFGIDTGATGVTLSQKDIAKYELQSSLHDLGVSMRTVDGFGGVGGELYYSKDLQIGPIEIQNAYISVGPGSESTIGIDILSRLRRFTLTDNGIKKFQGSEKKNCYRMRFTRRRLLDAVTYPFAVVPTSVGKLGLYLDSGETASGTLRHVDIFASAKALKYQVGKLAEEPVMRVPTILTTNGKVLHLKVPIYDVRIGEVDTQMLTSQEKIPDPMVTGSLGVGILRKFDVSYDFPGRKMCLTATKRPDSKLSRK